MSHIDPLENYVGNKSPGNIFNVSRQIKGIKSTIGQLLWV